MSTKIYYAWVCDIDKLNEFIDLIRPQVYNKAEKTIRNLMSHLTKKTIEEQREQNKYIKNENRLKLEAVLKRCREASKSFSRNPAIDIDFSLNIWLYNNRAYIIPIGELKDLSIPEFAKDFSYWNNTDSPDDITEEEWNNRDYIWSQINCGEGVHNHNARRLNHSIIDMSALYGDIDFEIEITQRIENNK